MTKEELKRLFDTHTNSIPTDVKAKIVALTEHMPVEFKNMKHRLYHLIHDIVDIPTCPVCNTKPVKWARSSPEYTETCGYACSAKKNNRDPVRRAKVEATNIAKYGAKAPAMNRTIVDKATKTKIDRYGTDGGEVWRDKIRTATKDKYGVDNVSKLIEVNQKKKAAWDSKSVDEIAVIQQKRVDMWMDTLGVDNPQKSVAVAAKKNATIRYRYGVDVLRHNPDVEQKIRNTTVERYGAYPASKNPEVIDKIINTHQLRYNRRSSAQRHIDVETILLLESKDWMEEQHHVNKRPLSSIAKELKVNQTTISSYMRRHDLEIRLYNSSAGEQEVADFVESLGLTVVRNSRSIIPPLELDIYIPEQNVAIEYCGLYWHSDAHERITPQYHKHKLDECTKLGIRLITMFEDEWVDKQAIVESKLKSILGRDDSQSIAARKTSIVAVSASNKRKFFDEYHIQGDGPGSITYGLTYNDTLVACMTFIHQGDKFILNRFASSGKVVGGFSKLLTHFKTNHSGKIVSFADLRWSNGGVYENNGFTLDKTLPVDYYWIVDGERHHKFSWRHDNRLKMLSNYDSNLSETANMEAHGYHKIYNCGLQRWIM